MILLVNRIFNRFAWETGILGSIKEYQDDWVIVLFIIGISSCCFGFKVYKAFFSLFIFMFIAMVSSYFMRNWTDWGTIVTTFSVIGTTVAFLAYSWDHLGGVVMSVLITIGLTLMISNEISIVIIACMLGAILVLLFPVITISLLTTLFGSIMLTEIFKLPLFMMMVFTLIGLPFQLLTNRKQQVFDKGYFDRIAQYRRKKKGRTV